MDQITNISSTAIQRYFNTLSKLGYKSYNDVNRLLVLLYIEEILTSEYLDFINEEDYNILIKTLYCLAGNSCMIKYPTFNNYDNIIHNQQKDLIPRVTENNILRFCEQVKIRTKI